MVAKYFLAEPVPPHRPGQANPILKPDGWTKSDPQIAVNAMIEIRFVTNIAPHANWPPERFRTASRIKSTVHVAAAQAREGVSGSVNGRPRIADVEVCEITLRGQEKPHRTSVGHHFGSEQAIEHGLVGSADRDRPGRGTCESFGERLVKRRISSAERPPRFL